MENKKVTLQQTEEILQANSEQKKEGILNMKKTLLEAVIDHFVNTWKGERPRIPDEIWSSNLVDEISEQVLLDCAPRIAKMVDLGPVIRACAPLVARGIDIGPVKIVGTFTGRGRHTEGEE